MKLFLLGLYVAGFFQHYRYEKPKTVIQWILTAVWFTPFIEWVISQFKKK